MKNKILPVGSIVKLNIMKEERKDTKFCILRRFILNINEKDEYFEYELMLYPGGTQDGKVILINSEQISEVVYYGYSDDEDILFINAREQLIAENDIKKANIY